MKYYIKIYLIILLTSVSQQGISQNTDHLFTYEVSAFKELQFQVNTEVIIIKSSRNRVLIQGDTFTQSSIVILEQEGRLAIYSKVEPLFKNPTRIVIETSSINSLVSGGTGRYFVLGLDQKQFTLHNPLATVYISGSIDDIVVYSDAGHTDLSDLNTKNERTKISENAGFVKSKHTTKDLLARNTDSKN
ncbi:MAG: DUF2807 domain-containing protein [Balneolaceae bacterium]